MRNETDTKKPDNKVNIQAKAKTSALILNQPNLITSQHFAKANSFYTHPLFHKCEKRKCYSLHLADDTHKCWKVGSEWYVRGISKLLFWRKKESARFLSQFEMQEGSSRSVGRSNRRRVLNVICYYGRFD